MSALGGIGGRLYRGEVSVEPAADTAQIGRAHV